jgi:hypothetical protein
MTSIFQSAAIWPELEPLPISSSQWMLYVLFFRVRPVNVLAEVHRLAREGFLFRRG